MYIFSSNYCFLLTYYFGCLLCLCACFTYLNLVCIVSIEYSVFKGLPSFFICRKVRHITPPALVAAWYVGGLVTPRQSIRSDGQESID